MFITADGTLLWLLFAGYLGKIVGFTDVDSERARAFISAGVTTLLDKPILPPVVAKLMQSECIG